MRRIDDHLLTRPFSVMSSQPDGGDLDLILDLKVLYQDRAVSTLLRQMETVNPALLRHSRSVTHLSLLMGRRLGFTPGDKRRLQLSCLLHDVGMMGVNQQLIEKKERLTREEWEYVQAHPLASVRLVSRFPYFGDLVRLVRHHHEWYDGTGYPDGLMREDIPLVARIIVLADAFAAMISERPYRATLTKDEALQDIDRNKGTQFDPNLVPPFISVVSERVETFSACAVGRND